MAKEMSIQISRTRIEVLHKLYGELIPIYVPENNHEHLLHCHLVAMYWRLDALVQKEKWQNMKFKISECEAMAFCFVWGDQDLTHEPFGDVIVREVIKSIDKHSKQIQRAR